MFDNRVRQGLLALWSPVICQRIVDTEGKCLLVALRPLEGGFRLPKLFIGQARDCCANLSVGLEASDFEYLPLGFGLGARGEVLADALPVEPTGDAEDDLPGGILELRNDERTEWFHARFATATGKSAFGFRRIVDYQLLRWRPHGDSNPGFSRALLVIRQLRDFTL